MAGKNRTKGKALQYGIFRGDTYSVPLYDLGGNMARYDTLDAARAALPELQDDENRMAAKWGYPAAKLVIQGC